MRRRQKGKVMVFNGSVPHLRSALNQLSHDEREGETCYNGDVMFKLGFRTRWVIPYATHKRPRPLQVTQRVNVLPDELSLYHFTHASLRVHTCPDLDIPTTEPRYRTVKANQTSSLQRPVKTSAKHLDKQCRGEMVPITGSQEYFVPFTR